MKEVTMWGIHAGARGDAESLFLKKSVVAIGWHEVGDLSKLEGNREAFKNAVARTYPDVKPGAIPNWAGQLYRFMYEMQKGDIVIYPSKRDREIHIGRVGGDYEYSTSMPEEYPNRRAVKWLGSFPRTHFTQGALYEVGSALSLFQVRNYAQEFRSALEGESIEVETAEGSPTAEDIEQLTRDFVLKRLKQELKGHPLADFIAHLLNIMGYHTRVSPEGPDGGVDIIAHRDELGFEPPIIKVQVKSTDGSVGDPETAALYGKVGSTEHGLLVTLGSFTKQAQAWAKTQSNLRLIDGQELVDLIFEHYEHFDARYKSILPLRRVYVPELTEEEG